MINPPSNNASQSGNCCIEILEGIERAQRLLAGQCKERQQHHAQSRAEISAIDRDRQQASAASPSGIDAQLGGSLNARPQPEEDGSDGDEDGDQQGEEALGSCQQQQSAEQATDCRQYEADDHRRDPHRRLRRGERAGEDLPVAALDRPIEHPQEDVLVFAALRGQEPAREPPELDRSITKPFEIGI